MIAACSACGISSLSNSSHFTPIENSCCVKPVMFPPGRARLLTNPAPTGSLTCANTIGMVAVAFCRADNEDVAEAISISGLDCTNCGGECQHAFDITRRVVRVNLDVATFHPTKLLQSVSKRAGTIFAFLRTFGLREQNADPPGAPRLRQQSAGRGRKSGAEQVDEFAPPHGAPTSSPSYQEAWRSRPAGRAIA